MQPGVRLPGLGRRTGCGQGGLRQPKHPPGPDPPPWFAPALTHASKPVLYPPRPYLRHLVEGLDAALVGSAGLPAGAAYFLVAVTCLRACLQHPLQKQGPLRLWVIALRLYCNFHGSLVL